MKEAHCKSCGAIYTMEAETVPVSFSCLCEGTSFSVEEA